MRSILVAIALACTAICQQSSGAEALLVAVQVRSDDSDLRDRLTSAFRNELRALRDVTVIVNGPREFELKVLAIGDASDFSASTACTEVAVCYLHSDQPAGFGVLCDAYIVSGGGAEQLREGVASAVASFDSHCLEPVRQARQRTK